jgi:hypothetical protein
MGFGSIIATGITVIVLVVTGYLAIAGTMNAVNSAEASIAGVRDARAEQIDTALAVAGVTQVDGSSMQVRVNNTGRKDIGNVSGLEVIVRFTDPASGTPVLGAWVPWMPDEPEMGDRWYPAGIMSMTRDASGSGMLAPGEMLTIVCDFDGPMPSGAGSVTVAAKNGACASGLFNFEGT